MAFRTSAICIFWSCILSTQLAVAASLTHTWITAKAKSSSEKHVSAFSISHQVLNYIPPVWKSLTGCFVCSFFSCTYFSHLFCDCSLACCGRLSDQTRFALIHMTDSADVTWHEWMKNLMTELTEFGAVDVLWCRNSHSGHDSSDFAETLTFCWLHFHIVAPNVLKIHLKIRERQCIIKPTWIKIANNVCKNVFKTIKLITISCFMLKQINR